MTKSFSWRKILKIIALKKGNALMLSKYIMGEREATLKAVRKVLGFIFMKHQVDKIMVAIQKELDEREVR